MEKQFVLVGPSGFGNFAAMPSAVWVVALVEDGNFGPIPSAVCKDEAHRLAQNYLLYGGRAFDAAAVPSTASTQIDFSGLAVGQSLFVMY